MDPISSIKDLEKGWLFGGGHFACSGCGAALGIKLTLKALGKNTIMINPAGCMTLTATYPFTPYKIPWVHNAIENAAATASGIYMGLKAKGKEKQVNIVPFAGDGATYDIGIGSLSGIAARNENIIYVCYNNESFANTGFEASTATPLYSRTNTTPIEQGGNPRQRKDMIKIMVAHNIPYAAKASVAFPLDYINKLRKAASIEGMKYIELLTHCVPGWIINSNEGIKIGKLLVESGLWPLYEVENKKLRITYNPKMIPVEKALKAQGRFKHLTQAQISRIQEIVNKEWEMLRLGKIFEAMEY